MRKKKFSIFHSSLDLTNGPILSGMLAFAMPIFFGQLLQQLYSWADAWVIGNFADTMSFAAVSSSNSMIFMLVGFFQGIGIGGGVVISRYFGMKNEKMVVKAIHTNILIGLIASVAATVLGTLFVPQILQLIRTPADVLPRSITYFRIYCAGISTVVMYNMCMAIMQALGDSLHPLFYLFVSCMTNIVLDVVLVAGFHLGVAGAAIATVFSQGLSVILCILHLVRRTDYTRMDFKKIKFYPGVLAETLKQGIPNGIQNSVISIGNIVIQANINAFGAYAMSGHGAYARIEGLVFMPIMSMSMAMPTFVSQNLGAGKTDRVKKGAMFGIAFVTVCAELLGILIRVNAPGMLRIFIQDEQAISFGMMHAHVTTLFFFLLAYSHCGAGVLRGCGKSIIPMVTMLLFWCGVRITYVTLAVKVWPVYTTVAWAYPLTWSLSAVTFTCFLFRYLKSDRLKYSTIG